MEKAETEYRIFQVRQLSPVEQAYLDTIKKSSPLLPATSLRAHRQVAVKPFDVAAQGRFQALCSQ